MSSESTAAKWLVGCLIAGVLGMLICAGGVGLLLYGSFGAARQMAQQAQSEIQGQIQEVTFAAQWRPPAQDAAPEALFPKAIGGWALVSHDDSTAIPELAIDEDGRHSTYESAGTTVDVYVYQVPSLDQVEVFEEARRAIDQAGYTTRSDQDMNLDSVHWFKFSFSPPERHGRMWWAKDRLIVTMTDNSAVNLQGFEREYVLAIQGPLVSEIAEPAIPAESPDVAEPEPLPTDSPDLIPIEPSEPDAPADTSEAVPAERDADPPAE